MKFAVKAMRGSEIVLLDMDADDAQAARARALAQGYSVLHCRAISHIGLSWPGQSLPGLSWQSQPAFDVSLFSQELLTLLESGLSLIEAIEGLAEKEQPGHARQVLAQLRTALYQGLPLSQALAQQQSLKAQCSESAYKPQSGGSVREMRKVSSGAMTE